MRLAIGTYAGTLDIDDLKLVKEGSDENLIANADFSGKHIQGWSTNWNGPGFSLAYETSATTDIEKPMMVVATKGLDDAYYTLQGMKVLRPTKGIYIHHGKKVVIK